MRLNLPLDNVPFLRLTPGEVYLEGSPSASSTQMRTDLVDLWKLRVLVKLLRFEHLTFLKVTILSHYNMFRMERKYIHQDKIPPYRLEGKE